MMNNWGCPHLTHDQCERINGRCDPASKKCILFGRVRRADPAPAKENNSKGKESGRDFKSGKGEEVGE